MCVNTPYWKLSPHPRHQPWSKLQRLTLNVELAFPRTHTPTDRCAFPPPTGMERLPFTFYALIQIAFLFVHYPTTRRFTRIVSLACLLTLLFCSYTKYSLQSPGEDYVLGCANGILLVTALHVVFSCPEFPNGLQRTGPMNQTVSVPSELPFAQKLGWMAELAGNARRIGFTHTSGAMNGAAVEVNVLKRERENSDARGFFVISRVTLSIVCLAIFHFTLIYRLHNPSFDPALHENAHDGKFIRGHSSLLRRLWEVVVWTAGVVSEMTFLQAAAAALSVGSGVFNSEDWPLIFGSPTHAYSVRRFWS